MAVDGRETIEAGECVLDVCVTAPCKRGDCAGIAVPLKLEYSA